MREELTELLGKIDVELYLDREGLEYKLTRGSSGQQLNLKHCPVCGGSEWKVYLNADTGLGNCFHGSCETKFNLFSFMRANLGGTTQELMRHIKAVAVEHGWRQKKKTVYAVDDLGGLKFPESVELPIDGKNLKYLTQRGITPEIAKYFFLRYCKEGYFRYNDGEKERKQNYSSRVIIPIYDLEGTLVSFQGRDITGESDRKYLFPPGFSSTGKFLYNGHNAIGSKRVVINEGVFDVFATKIALDQDVNLRDVTPIGSFGKHLSNGFGNDQVEQLLKLKAKGLREVTFMWDAERDAIKEAIKSALLVSRMGLIAKVAILPKGKDPNEALPEQVRESFYRAEKITRISAAKLMTTIAHF